jgi:predicted transcriptional regulator
MSGKVKHHLSDLEWEIMQAIWKIGKYPVSVRDVLSQKYPNGEKAYTTVQTVMNNLVAKQFLRREKIGNVNAYTPTHKRREVVAREIQNFVSKAFSGSFNAFVSFLMDTQNLSPEEIEELKQVIEKRQEQK